MRARLDSYLCHRACGGGDGQAATEDLNGISFENAYEHIAKKASAAKVDRCLDSHEHNRSLARRLTAGELAAPDALAAMEIIPDIRPKTKISSRYHGAQHRAMYGWSDRDVGDKPRTYLTPRDPSMKGMRSELKNLVARGLVHKRCIVNVDHVYSWKMKAQHRKQWKPFSRRGHVLPCIWKKKHLNPLRTFSIVKKAAER